MKRVLTILSCLIVLLLIVAWWRMPLTVGDHSKQTIYVGLLDTWYGASKDDIAHAMWIDDDSTEGVLLVKKIADEVGIKPNFAVIADKMTPEVADSLATWQMQGAGIVLHGLRHERWKTWTKEQIENDIRQSISRLAEQGFDTTKLCKLVIPPHGCNTIAIRSVIKKQGYKMISGATLVNPDRNVFQFGRIGIGPDTDVEAMRLLLQKAYDRKAFIIFGTHSSIPSWFSVEKTREVLTIAKDIGFEFIP